MTKKVPPYLRHTKPPYTIHAYSPILAARADMVPWYKPPVIVRVDPIIHVPDIEVEPDNAMTDRDFEAMVAEQNRIEALKAATKGSGTLEAVKDGKVKAVDYNVNEPYVFEAEPDHALSEADFDRIKEPEVDDGPTTPIDHDTVSVNAPVDGTPEGHAAKVQGKPTRRKAAVDDFAGVTPAVPKKPALSSPFTKSRTY